MKRHMARRMKKWFLTQKLKDKVRYLFLGIIGLYLVLFVFIYIFFIKRSMLNYTLESNYNTMISIGNNLNSELSTINSMSKLLTGNSNINTYLLKDKPGTRFSHNAITSMYDITNTFKYVSSVYLYRLDGKYIHITNGITIVNQYILEEEEWFKEIVDARGGYVLDVNGGGAFFRKSGKPLISFMRIVNDIETQQPIGLMIINLSDDILKDSYKDMTSDDKQFYYYDKNLKLINQGIDTELERDIEITSKTFNQTTIGPFGNKKILSYYHIPETPFVIAGIEKMSYVEFIPSNATWIIISLIILTILSLILIGLFISMYITTPIERLVQSMDVAKRGWLRRVSLKLPDDEIGHLKNSYNNMLVAINQLINELLENEKAMQKAELDVLQEQIKPHFLYNTLDTIAYLALQESSENVYDAIETLGNFYRRFLSKGSKVISIRDEVAIVKDYLKLQKLRYDDIIEDEYDLCDDLLEVHVPKLILQPLVENSIYHGIRLKGEKGLIKISVFQKDDFIHIVVYDSGVGMNEEQLDQIMQDNNKSFGFKGTIERIQYYYGKEDVFEIKSVEGIYTEIDLKIPL
ncbi:two-component system sensor histidine kinase YesM [Mobilisporobacter senegalensis]|uniref:Two-component system sensor histidine kinase YesM n=1 Tax=Mobilisporobacter senegalensis TaxID=1329262 RepID=A0A3N1XXV9_9FIRM|nr:histidine kinase [Mobilisporobacter senegalensis]ROR31420.1 two-component system sensor histidine kinase YesM [Mobilisporobacter senegalensis]